MTMTYSRILRGSLVSLCVLCGITAAAAQTAPRTPAQAPAPTPPLFSRVGVINHIDQTAGTIVINDTQYRLPPTVHVYTYERGLKEPKAQRTDKQLKDAKALRDGLRIGYNVAGEGGGQRGELTEAWLLPAGHIPELQAGEKSEESSKGENQGTSQGSRTQRTTPRAQTTR